MSMVGDSGINTDNEKLRNRLKNFPELPLLFVGQLNQYPTREVNAVSVAVYTTIGRQSLSRLVFCLSEYI